VNPSRLAQAVKERAVALGFDAVGIADLSRIPHADALDRWLAGGMAGTMTYLHRQAARRREPATIAPGAIRAIVVTRAYGQADPPRPLGHGRIAKYARGPDYHRALAGPLGELAAFVRGLGPTGTTARAFVDAGPVPERELAQRAGLGWIGKNTMLIDPRRGSFFFIATVLTSLELATDAPFEADRCGTCRRCLDACPTAAFPEERVLDSRRCISYLTIEYRGAVPADLALQVGDWVFGCDVCQDVCPWNVSFASHRESEQDFDPWLSAPPLRDLAELTDAAFDLHYGASAVARTGPGGMRRNALVALANSGREGACRTP
jgi:epoxyqueuosine reductase